MKLKLIGAVLCLMLFGYGCGTTFQERMEVYKAAYAEVKALAPIAAKVFLSKQVADGKLTQAEADEIAAALK